MQDIPFQDPKVAEAFDRIPAKERASLMQIRNLIFQVAADNPRVGKLSEERRWGQPAYLTPETKSGSTIRLGLPKTGGYAIFTHCQSSLMADFRHLAPDLTFDGNRAVIIEANTAPPLPQLAILIQNALTYHL